jgi:hypothetical protein
MTSHERPTGSPGLRDAWRARKARKGPALESDKPRHPSRPPKGVLPGQIDVYEALEEIENEKGESNDS